MSTLITHNISVSSLVQQFSESKIAIPEIQRDVVWKPKQVKALLDSIYQGYPCGSLILWEPRVRDASLVKSMIRPERLEQLQGRLPEDFSLDGQQRLTSLATAFGPGRPEDPLARARRGNAVLVRRPQALSGGD